MRSIIIGLSNELPLTAPETLEIADSLVRRAATVKMTPAWMQGTLICKSSGRGMSVCLLLHIRYR